MEHRQDKKRIRTALWIFLICLMCPMFWASTLAQEAAGTDTHLAISQMVQEDDEVLLYINELDETDRPAGNTLGEDSLVILSETETYKPISVETGRSPEEKITWYFCVDALQGEAQDSIKVKQLRSILSEFIGSLNGNDAVRLIVSGEEVGAADVLADDREALQKAVYALKGGDGKEEDGFWPCLEAALSSRTDEDDQGGRAAVIVLTENGPEDSASPEDGDALRLMSARARIPVYVGVLEETDADLTEAERFARQTGGSLYRAGKEGPAKLLRLLKEVVEKACQVRIKPAPEEFGKNKTNTNWKAALTKDGSRSSSGYVFTLNETKETKEALTEGHEASVGTVEALTESGKTVAVAESALTEKITEAGPAAGSAAGGKKKQGFAEQMKAFISENLFIIVAAAMMIIACIIVIVALVKGKKGRSARPKLQEYDDPSYSSFAPGGVVPSGPSKSGPGISMPSSGLEKTIDEYSYDSEKTVDEYSMLDNEKTVDGSSARGIRLAFHISFCGRMQTIERMIVDQLVIGRGEKSDVDVVFGQRNDEAKQTSREHCIITYRMDGLFVRDNGSRNGTVLNGRELHGEMPLRNEDVLQMGKSIVQIRIDRSSL